MALVPFANKRAQPSQEPSPFDGLFADFSLLEDVFVVQLDSTPSK